MRHFKDMVKSSRDFGHISLNSHTLTAGVSRFDAFMGYAF